MEQKTIFYNVTEAPFKIHGLLPVTPENGFRRMPESVFECMTAPLMKEQRLHTNTAGGRVRFRTDATSITLKAKLDPSDYSANSSDLLRRNFDLYREFGGKEFFETTFISWEESHAQGNKEQTRVLKGEGMRDFTLYMPCYGNVYSLELGFPEGAKIEAAAPYKFETPVVFLGSSITQGGCACRSGVTYQAYLSRRLGFDYINLGFSGSCRAEKELMEYIADLPMSAFVYDYDHNSPSEEHYEQTHLEGYKIIREKNPDLPFIIVTKPDFMFGRDSDVIRRITAQKTFHYAFEHGDRNVYYIDGSSFFTGSDRGDFTTDMCHPNDAGMLRMADAMTDTLHYALHKISDKVTVEKHADIW